MILAAHTTPDEAWTMVLEELFDDTFVLDVWRDRHHAEALLWTCDRAEALARMAAVYDDYAAGLGEREAVA